MPRSLLSRLFLLLLLTALGFGAAGCVGIQSNPDSDLPNNAPATWEGKSLGIPM